MATRTIEGKEAKSLTRQQKWEMLSPYLKQHGRGSLAYSTLQDGLEYFVDDDRGYVAYAPTRHLLLAPRGRKLVLSDPICSPPDREKLVDEFLKQNPRATFFQVYEDFARELSQRGFGVSCMGIESEIDVQNYNIRGNNMDHVKRGINEAKKEKIKISERKDFAEKETQTLEAISQKWISDKSVKNKEIWFFTRPIVFEEEQDVRKFIAYDSNGGEIGYCFFDPLYTRGEIIGYAANTIRTDPTQKIKRLTVPLIIDPLNEFKTEKIKKLNLALSPFLIPDEYSSNDLMQVIFENFHEYGEKVYPFKGLSFHKSRFRSNEIPVFLASSNKIPPIDIYLGFKNSGIINNTLTLLRRIELKGLLNILNHKKPTISGQ